MMFPKKRTEKVWESIAIFCHNYAIVRYGNTKKMKGVECIINRLHK
jgi:hypothetical protein